MDMNVARLIADHFERRFGGAEFEICVRDEAVLRHVEADGDSGRVAVPQLEIDVAETAVERELAGVRDGLTCWRTLVCVPQHVVIGPALESVRVCRQNENGATCAIADEANAGPNVDGMLDWVASFFDEDNPVMCRLLQVIDCGLEGGALIPVRAGRAHVHGLRVVGAQREDRLRSRDLAT